MDKIKLRAAAWLFAAALLLCRCAAFAAEEPDALEKDMPWSFAAYEEPDFMAKRVCAFSPQTVRVVASKHDGWLLINTYLGEYWIYGEKNLCYIEKAVDLYDGIGGEAVAAISPQIVEITAAEGDWLEIKTWLGRKWINPRLRRVRVTLDVPSYSQRALGYMSGCEIVSTGMMINFVNPVPVRELAGKMPLSHDPYKGFVGDIKYLDGGFTVFPSALTGLVSEYLGLGRDMSGCSADDLKDSLAAGAPVVVWVAGLGFNVHAVCLTGYDEGGFFYNDPWTGAKDKYISYKNFNAIWNKALSDRGLNVSYPGQKALSFDPGAWAAKSAEAQTAD